MKVALSSCLGVAVRLQWESSPERDLHCGPFAFVPITLPGHRKESMGKLTIYMGLTVGGIIGGYLPVALLHVSTFSILSIVCGFVGSVVGLWVG